MEPLGPLISYRTLEQFFHPSMFSFVCCSLLFQRTPAQRVIPEQVVHVQHCSVSSSSLQNPSPFSGMKTCTSVMYMHCVHDDMMMT